MGAPSTDNPQLTSKVVFLVLKQERFDDSGIVALAAWTTCDLSLITSTEDCKELLASSSEDELDEDELDESSLSESESTVCWSSVPSSGCSHLLVSIFGWSICSS